MDELEAFRVPVARAVLRMVAEILRPVGGVADQPAHPFQRLFHGECVVALEGIGAEFLFRLQAGIGAHQVDQPGLPFGAPLAGNGFGRAARHLLVAEGAYHSTQRGDFTFEAGIRLCAARAASSLSRELARAVVRVFRRVSRVTT